jgi:hypothetical protein
MTKLAIKSPNMSGGTGSAPPIITQQNNKLDSE